MQLQKTSPELYHATTSSAGDRPETSSVVLSLTIRYIETLGRIRRATARLKKDLLRLGAPYGAKSVDEVRRLVPRFESPSTSKRTKRRAALREGLNNAETLRKQAYELESWLGLPHAGFIEDRGEEHETIKAWQAEGASGSEARSLMKKLKVELTRGRPATKRPLAVKALDYYNENPKLSWSQVTRKLCNCGKTDHDQRCQERLRQTVNDLRQFLKALSISIPARPAR